MFSKCKAVSAAKSSYLVRILGRRSAFRLFYSVFAVDLVRVLGVPVLPAAKEDRLALIEPMAVFCDDVY